MTAHSLYHNFTSYFCQSSSCCDNYFISIIINGIEHQVYPPLPYIPAIFPLLITATEINTDELQGLAQPNSSLQLYRHHFQHNCTPPPDSSTLTNHLYPMHPPPGSTQENAPTAAPCVGGRRGTTTPWGDTSCATRTPSLTSALTWTVASRRDTRPTSSATWPGVTPIMRRFFSVRLVFVCFCLIGVCFPRMYKGTFENKLLSFFCHFISCNPFIVPQIYFFSLVTHWFFSLPHTSSPSFPFSCFL